jgi:hypothetical protein
MRFKKTKICAVEGCNETFKVKNIDRRKTCSTKCSVIFINKSKHKYQQSQEYRDYQNKYKQKQRDMNIIRNTKNV